MTPADKIFAMEKIFTTALTLASKKGRDYSGNDDGLGNFRTFGWKGIVVRLEDKMQRVIQFCKTGSFKVKDESVEDTLLDLINYAALTLIMYREENKNQAGCATEKTFETFVGTCGDKVGIKKPVLDEKSLRFKNMLDNIFLQSMLNNPIYLRTGRIF